MEQELTKEAYAELVAQLNHYCDSYYNKSISEISDQEYDELFDKLEVTEQKHPDWISPNSPTQRVGITPNGSFQKMKHPVRMFSLAKARSLPALQRLLQRSLNAKLPEHLDLSTVNRQLFYVDYKMDGVSCDLIYRDGRLAHAITRGNGIVGDVVTPNVQQIPNIPMRIVNKNIVYIRGEVVVHKADFAIVNAQREQEGLPVFSNTRNYASGSLRQKDADVTNGRALKFYAWEYLELGKTFSYQEQTSHLIKLGFSIPHGKMCNGLSEVMEHINQIAKERDNLPYDIDGMVVKIDHPEIRKVLGFNNHDPLWAMAWKFSPIGVETTIEDVDWIIGRTGKLTPVARIKPITIDGVRIVKVNLYNLANVTTDALGIGSVVQVVRSGDVIPKISTVLEPAKEFNIPKVCPYCGKSLEVKSSDLICTNPECVGVFSAWLKYIVSKDGLNIKGLGETFVDELIKSKTITKFEDLFLPVDNKSDELKDSDINLLITTMRQIDLSQLLMILNIGNIGRSMAFKISIIAGSLMGFVNYLNHPDQFRTLTLPKSIINTILTWYENPRSKEILQHLSDMKLPRL